MADKKRSPKLVAIAVKLYRELRSTQKVARRLELGASTTYRMLRSAGVRLPARHSPEVQQVKKSLQGEIARRVAEEYAAGAPLSQLRKKYGVGTWAIRTAAKDCGVELREKGAQRRQFSDDDLKEIKRLYTEDNWSQGQIAAQFNSSASMINRLCRVLGVEARGHKARGERHGSWNGGRVKIGEYMAVAIPANDPMRVMAHRTGYVIEHRLVMARALGRPLVEHETVHHLDGDKTNNAISNLQLRIGKHGRGVALRCRCCGSLDIESIEL